MRTIIASITVLFILTSFLDRSLSQGMFLDGIIYASISRNMALGIGGLWTPVFQMPWFEHPPAYFWIESLAFKVLGDHFWVEKLFSGMIWFGTLLMLLHAVKQLTNKSESSKDLQLFSLLLWSIMPVVLWSYPNNMLDNLLGLLCLGAVIDFHKGMKYQKLFYFISGTGLTALALLVKGPVGLFPLIIPFLYLLILDKTKTKITIQAYFIISLILGIFASILLINSDSSAFIQTYIHQQVIASLAGKREVVQSVFGRAFILFQIGIQLFAPLALICLLWGIQKLAKWKNPDNPSSNKTLNGNLVKYILAIGLSASLPLMISIKQRDFYLIPALPYFAIALAFWKLNLFRCVSTLFISDRNLRGFRILSLFALVGLGFYSLTKFGKLGRDAEVIHDISNMKTSIPYEAGLDICPEMHYEWSIQAYAQRILRTKMNLTGQNNYFMTDKTQCQQSFMDGLERSGFNMVKLPNYRLELWKKKNQGISLPKSSQ